jgi:hypothetical protein
MDFENDAHPRDEKGQFTSGGGGGGSKHDKDAAKHQAAADQHIAEAKEARDKGDKAGFESKMRKAQGFLRKAEDSRAKAKSEGAGSPALASFVDKHAPKKAESAPKAPQRTPGSVGVPKPQEKAPLQALVDKHTAPKAEPEKAKAPEAKVAPKEAPKAKADVPKGKSSGASPMTQEQFNKDIVDAISHLDSKSKELGNMKGFTPMKHIREEFPHLSKEQFDTHMKSADQSGHARLVQANDPSRISEEDKKHMVVTQSRRPEATRENPHAFGTTNNHNVWARVDRGEPSGKPWKRGGK